MKLKDMVHGAKCLVLGAMVAVGLSSFAAEPEAVQLWEGGPYWATVNVGTPESHDPAYPAEYGALYKFNGDEAKNAAESLGAGWRLPTKEDFDKLVNTSYCTSAWDDTKKGYTFTGATEGYKDKSIFLPAAGLDGGYGREDAGGYGYYWSSEADGDAYAWLLYFCDGTADMYNEDRNSVLSVRAVRDTPPVSGPSVTVDKVESADPWDSTTGKITVNYTLGGTDAATDYKVAFDITADGQTMSVTNDAAKVTDGAATKTINTVALFGQEVTDPQAKVKVSLIKAEKAAGVQLWADGPFFAECNVGADTPEDYGILAKFNDAANAVTDAMGAEWRVPSKGDFDKLVNTSYCTRTWDNTKKGYTFTGVTAGYTDKSIFLPAAGVGSGGGARQYAKIQCSYWSSKAYNSANAYILYLDDSGFFFVDINSKDDGLSVRAVRDAGESDGGPSEAVVATDEMEFQLGPTPGSEANPWTVGEGVEAWTNGTVLVIGGEGSVAALAGVDGLADLLAGLTAINVASNGVTGVASDAFQGVGGGNIALTLPDGWQGELPDEDGAWYGATVDMTSFVYPLAVKNVTFQQRYPWNGKVDIGCDLTGAGKVTLNATAFTNGVKFVEAETIVGETTVDFGAAGGATNGVKFVWDAAKDCPAGFNASDVTIAVTAEKVADGVVKDPDPYNQWASCGGLLTWAGYGGSTTTADAKSLKAVYKEWVKVGETWQDGAALTGETAFVAHPALALRFVTGDSTVPRIIGGSFTPFDIAGLMVEPSATGYKIQQGGTGPWATRLGDFTTGGSSWFVINENFYVTRPSGPATFYGDVHLDIASGKIFDVNSTSTTNPAKLDPATHTCLHFHGAGKLKIKNLDATGAVTLDYREVTSGDACLQGNLIVDASTSFMLPATVSAGQPFKLCTGSVTGGGSVAVERSIMVGDKTYSAQVTIVNNQLTYQSPRDESEDASAIAAKSEAGALDLRTEVTLAAGETMYICVGYSDTAWGAVSAADVTFGWTNLTTGATKALVTGLDGDGVLDVNLPNCLPKQNGAYKLTHSTGGLTSILKFTVTGYPLGCETNPWEIGAGDDPASVTAYTNGVGTLMIDGSGAIADFDDGAPWDAVASEIKVVDVGAGITKLGDGAFGELTGVESNIFENAEMPINPDAFADSEGQIANEPKFYVRNEEGGLDEVLEFTLEDGTVYDTLAEALDAGETEVFGVTLPIAKEQAIEALTDLAYGEERDEPMSEAVTNALNAVIAEITAATTLDEVGDAAEAGEIAILTLVCQERDMPIEGSALAWRMVVDGSKTNLVIKGEGPMPDFDGEDDELDTPWDPVAGMITDLVLSNGVESVGNEAFMLCENLESLYYEDMEMPLNLHAFIGEYYDEEELVAATNLPTTVLVLVGEEVREPNGWRGDDGVMYDTLLEALEAGCTNVHIIVGAYVEFNALGGVFADGLDVLTNFFVSAYTLPSAPTRADYEFLGWYDGWTNGASVVTDGQALLRYETHSLYAKWKSTKLPPSPNPNEPIIYTDGAGTILRPTNAVPAQLVLPETDTGAADGTPLTKIDAKAFAGLSSITKVELPLFVTDIGDRAFYNDVNLGEVVFVQPRDYNTLAKVPLSIGERAFAGSKLSSITIPSTTSSIGAAAFANCKNLSEVTILGAVTISGNYPFRDSGTAVGGLTIKLSPRAAADAAFLLQLTNGCNNVVIDPQYAGEITATDIRVGTPEAGKVEIDFTYSANDVDINVDTVTAVPGLGTDPVTAQDAMIPTEVRANGGTSYTAVFDLPADSSGFFRITVNIEK